MIMMVKASDEVILLSCSIYVQECPMDSLTKLGSWKWEFLLRWSHSSCRQDFEAERSGRTRESGWPKNVLLLLLLKCRTGGVLSSSPPTEQTNRVFESRQGVRTFRDLICSLQLNMICKLWVFYVSEIKGKKFKFLKRFSKYSKQKQILKIFFTILKVLCFCQNWIFIPVTMVEL
jgi:hypothetical protein